MTAAVELTEKPAKKGTTSDTAGGAGTIDLEKDEAKSGAAAPSSRLKAPPSDATSTKVSTAGASKAHVSSKGQQDKEGLRDDVLTQVSQQKFEAQEEKLKDVARHAMSSLRDFHKLSAVEYAKKVTEIRKALMKYEMQYVRVWELQDRNRQSDADEAQSVSDRFHRDAEAETAVIAQLTTQLGKEKLRKRRYEVHEATAAQINQKRTRVELQADIDAKTGDIEKLRKQNKDLKDQAVQIQQRGQLLREAAQDLTQLLAIQMESSAGTAPVTKASASRKAAQPVVVEVIS